MKFSINGADIYTTRSSDILSKLDFNKKYVLAVFKRSKRHKRPFIDVPPTEVSLKLDTHKLDAILPDSEEFFLCDAYRTRYYAVIFDDMTKAVEYYNSEVNLYLSDLRETANLTSELINHYSDYLKTGKTDKKPVYKNPNDNKLIVRM